MFWDILYNNVIVFALVFARITGIFSFNPIFSRNNIPTMVKVGLSLILSMIIVPTLSADVITFDNTFAFVFAIIREGLIGLVFGFLVNLFMSMILYAGEIIDTQIGLGMAKVMDPTTGANVAIFASMYTMIFTLYFFVTNSHLSYIKLFSLSYETIPIGTTELNLKVGYIIASYFSTILIFAVKFALPIIAAEMLLEICIGILMKAVPSIHVFVINIPLKVALGLIVLIAIAGPMAEYIDSYMGIMFENLYSVMGLMGA